MKLTNLEKIYLKNFKTAHKVSSIPEILEKAYEVERQMRCTRPTNRTQLCDLLRQLTLLSNHAGLMEKAQLQEDQENTLALFVTTRENVVNGQRTSIRKELIKAFNESDIPMIGLYFCEDGQDPMLNTYAVVLDTPPGSDDHKQIERAIERYDLDIRITSRKWFTEQTN